MRPLRAHQDELERWRPVPGWDDLYEVSDLGGMRSLDRLVPCSNGRGGYGQRSIAGRRLVLTPDRRSYGRLTVKLCSPKGQRTKLVHQLVAAAFIGPRPLGAEVGHGDGDCTNNRAINLRYVTSAENTADKYRHGTILRGERAAGAKLTREAVLEIRNLRGRVTQATLADRFGVGIAQICRVQAGQQWAHV